MRLRSVIATAAALAAAATLLVSPAQAATSTDQVIDLTANEEAIVRDFLAGQLVDVATQDALIAKYESGVLWDSLTGVEPVSVSDSVNPITGDQINVARFPDGSVTVRTAQVPQARAGVGTFAPSNSCPSSGTGSFVDCRIDMNNGIQRMYFYADYRIGTSARISKAYGVAGYVFAGTFSPGAEEIIRSVAQETPYAAAHAQASGTFSTVGMTTTVTLHLYAYRGNAWTADS